MGCGLHKRQECHFPHPLAVRRMHIQCPSSVPKHCPSVLRLAWGPIHCLPFKYSLILLCIYMYVCVWVCVHRCAKLRGLCWGSSPSLSTIFFWDGDSHWIYSSLLGDVFLYAVNIYCSHWLVNKLLCPMPRLRGSRKPKERDRKEKGEVWRNSSLPPKKQHASRPVTPWDTWLNID